ncbi:MAG TPA: hypothetical protein VFA62_07335 [Acidimicrobiia bacterium]|nr:hypothetical protein [Acidimicrobiia bacterium]
MTTVEDVTAGVESPSVSPPMARIAFRLFLASIAIALVPVAVATARAIHDGWIPTGDNALFAVRARDLFSLTNLPLLGTWSSASVNAGMQLNHPGPLYLDLLAAPARVVDSGAGVAFGAALINAACIAAIAFFAYRRGGALAGTLAMAATAALCWAMGSEVLFEPWNPHSAMLPFALFLVLVWSMTCGDLLAVPVAAGVGSLVVQSHLSYALLAPLLGLWGVLGLVLWARRTRRDRSGAWPDLRRRLVTSAGIGGVVLAVCWIQPLIEQFTSEGSGNLTRLAHSATKSNADTIGFGVGTRVVATVVALPPWWFRPSLHDAFAPGWHAPSLALAGLSLLVVVAVLAGCAWAARRRRDRVALWAVGTAGFGLLAALVTAAQGPVTVFGQVTPHTFRWLWSLGAFLFFAVALTIARRFAAGDGARAQPVVLVSVVAAVTLVFAALNLPYADEGLGPNSQEYAIPASHDLARGMGTLDSRGPLLIDGLFRAGFADPYGAAVVADLQRRGIPFVTGDPVLVRQYGPARRFDGHNARAQLLLRTGAGARDAPPGSRRVALGEGLSRAERRELSRLEIEIRAYLDAGRLRLDERGQAALARGELPELAAFQSQSADARALLDSRELNLVTRRRYLVLDGRWARRFDRYADLQQRADQETVALFVAPPS